MPWHIIIFALRSQHFDALPSASVPPRRLRGHKQVSRGSPEAPLRAMAQNSKIAPPRKHVSLALDFFPPWKSCRSICNEVSTFLLSGGDFFCMYSEINIQTLPEQRFALRAMTYQHFDPPRTAFCSTCNELSTFLLSSDLPRTSFWSMCNEI